jgi:PPOX class probable F420-dependent enzyme
VRLTEDEARARLAAHDHGVLATLHPARGVDAVPVVYAVDGPGLVGIPVDRVKPKARQRLRREDNLAADPRATLLVEQWDRDDWSRLWWVRAHLRAVADPGEDVVDRLADRLAATFEQYRDRPFDRVVVLEVVGVGGWSALG